MISFNIYVRMDNLYRNYNRFIIFELYKSNENLKKFKI